MIGSTHTYALLDVSDAAYQEIATKLRAAGYDSAFGADGQIDMHGIALARHTLDEEDIFRVAVAARAAGAEEAY